MKNLKKMLAVLLAAAMMLAAVPALGESAAASTTNDQRLDAAYTLALNAINAEDYATAKEYLDICFAYCDRQSNPVLFADLLLVVLTLDALFPDLLLPDILFLD